MANLKPLSMGKTIVESFNLEPSRSPIRFTTCSACRRNSRSAILTVLCVCVTAVCASAVGLALFVLPLSFLVHSISRALLQRDVQDPNEGMMAINPTTWTADETQQLTEVTPFVVFYAVRYCVFGLAADVTFAMVVFVGLPKQYVRQTMLLIWITLVLFLFTVGFGVVIFDGVINGWLHLTYHVHLTLLLAWQSLTWTPTMLGFFLYFLFPRSSMCRNVGMMISMVCGATLAYLVNRALFLWYFQLQNTVVRLLLGVIIPHLLGSFVFDLFFLVASSLSVESDPKAATLLMSIPVSWTIATGAMLQLGSLDFASGVIMELLSLVFEVKSKWILMSGMTPWECAWHRARTLVSSCCTSRESKVVVFDATFSEVVVPSQPNTQTRETADASRRKEILISTVRNSNLSELIVHMLVAGLFVLVKLNPNHIGADPIPWQRAVALVALKISAELITDLITLACWPANSDSVLDSPLGCFAKDACQMVDWMQLLQVSFITICWTMDMQYFYITFLCPSSASGGRELLSLGPCPPGNFA